MVENAVRHGGTPQAAVGLAADSARGRRIREKKFPAKPDPSDMTKGRGLSPALSHAGQSFSESASQCCALMAAASA